MKRTDETMNILSLRTHNPTPHTSTPVSPPQNKYQVLVPLMLLSSHLPINHCVQSSAVTGRGTHGCTPSSGSGLQGPIPLPRYSHGVSHAVPSRQPIIGPALPGSLQYLGAEALSSHFPSMCTGFCRLYHSHDPTDELPHLPAPHQRILP